MRRDQLESLDKWRSFFYKKGAAFLEIFLTDNDLIHEKSQYNDKRTYFLT